MGPPPPTNDTQTFADVSLATMPDLDFTADDFLGDDDDLNHESSEEHVRDLELNVNLPEMVDVPPPTPSAPGAGEEEAEDFGDLVQRELVEERADLDGRKLRFPSSVLYKTQNEYRAEAWKGSDNQKIYDNKYVINADTQKIDCYTVSDKCLSFTAKVIARSNIPIRVNISVGTYQSAENGHAKTIHIPTEDLDTYCQHLGEMLEGGERTRRFTVNTNEFIDMETTATELVIKQVVPDDIKILSQELATRRKALDKGGSFYFEAKKDGKVRIIRSEVAAYVKAMKQAYDFVKFLKTCNAMRLATFAAVTQRFCRTPARYHRRIYYEHVVAEFHNLKVDTKYKWPIAIVMKHFVNSYANEAWAQNFDLTD